MLTMRNVSSTAVSTVAADKRGKIHADGASAVELLSILLLA